MAITQIQLYQVFQSLFKTEEPKKDQVIQYGVMEQDFDAADFDDNQYLSLEEGFNSKTISEFLYSKAVSAYGDAVINNDNATASGLTNSSDKEGSSVKPKTNARKFGSMTGKKA